MHWWREAWSLSLIPSFFFLVMGNASLYGSKHKGKQQRVLAQLCGAARISRPETSRKDMEIITGTKHLL